MVAGVVLRVSSCVSLCPSWRRTWKDTASGADGRPFAPHCRAPRFLHFFVFVYNITGAGALLGRWRWSWGFGFYRFFGSRRVDGARTSSLLCAFMALYALSFIILLGSSLKAPSSQLSALSVSSVAPIVAVVDFPTPNTHHFFVFSHSFRFSAFLTPSRSFLNAAALA